MVPVSSLSKLCKLDNQPQPKNRFIEYYNSMTSNPLIFCRYCKHLFLPSKHSKLYCSPEHAQLYRQLRWRRNNGKQKLSEYGKEYRERRGEEWTKYHREETKADRKGLPKPHLRKEKWVNKEESLLVVREANGRFI
jgi:hypothetical protein